MTHSYTSTESWTYTDDDLGPDFRVLSQYRSFTAHFLLVFLLVGIYWEMIKISKGMGMS